MTTEQPSLIPSQFSANDAENIPAHQRLQQLGKVVVLMTELILCLYMTAGDYFVSI